MREENILPFVNENGYYEMRLESIGGLGANLCGKMLGELGALYLSLNASSFSSYGSEKRGSPVKAYIRWCHNGKSVRVNSPVTRPHILGIFHEGLLGKYPVMDGVDENTRIILNTPMTQEEAAARTRLNLGELYCLDALAIAMECKSRINMVMLGAIAKASGFIPLDMVEELCRDTIGRKYPALIDANLEGVRRGYEQAAGFKVKPGPASGRENGIRKENFVWGYRNAPIGGVNPRAGSSVSNDLSPSREGYIPLFLQDKCINCGLCDSTCPDMVFQFRPGVYRGKESMVNAGLDYYHCKGCLRCVEVCPTGALIKALEKDYPDKPWFVPNQELLPDAIRYEKNGPNSWVTSDSYMDEKRVDGGVV